MTIGTGEMQWGPTTLLKRKVTPCDESEGRYLVLRVYIKTFLKKSFDIIQIAEP
jgi:hypothetical protein